MRTQFFTGAGDDGKSKIGMREISKADFLFDVLGDLDELNSWVGFCKVEAEKLKSNNSFEIRVILKQIQETLFIAQAEIAAIGLSADPPAGGNSNKITAEKTEFLEKIIGEIDSVLLPLRNFVIPGGSELSARLDVARAVARRVEKAAISYGKEKELSSELLKFLNRLSSCLFALARYVNYKLDKKEEHPSYE